MKASLKEIREQTRNEVAKQYNKKISDYEERIHALHLSHEKMWKKCDELSKENDELKEKLHIYEDWINRLQDFCNLPDEEREKAVKQYQTNIEVNEKLDSLMAMYTRFFNI